jgi:hypothetical protein
MTLRDRAGRHGGGFVVDGERGTRQGCAATGDTGGRWWCDDSGDIITSWLVQLLVFLAVVAFVAFEVISVVVTNVRLDETAREVARAARDEYRAVHSLDRATSVAEEVAATYDAEVVTVTEDGDELVVELHKQAPTLVIHRIGVLDDLTTASATSRIGRTP